MGQGLVRETKCVNCECGRTFTAASVTNDKMSYSYITEIKVPCLACYHQDAFVCSL